MLFDFSTQLAVTAPGSGVQIAHSPGAYDLRGGAGLNGATDIGAPPLFGTGNQLFMHFEVTTAFAANLDPVANFGVAIGDNANPSAGNIHVLGLSGGSIDGSGFVGLTETQLALGTSWTIPIPAWEDIMEAIQTKWPNRKDAGDLALFRLFRYMSIVMIQPRDPTITTGDYFSSGVATARVLQCRGDLAVLSNQYPTRMGVE